MDASRQRAARGTSRWQILTPGGERNPEANAKQLQNLICQNYSCNRVAIRSQGGAPLFCRPADIRPIGTEHAFDSRSPLREWAMTSVKIALYKFDNY
jgi:hypothetical protein